MKENGTIKLIKLFKNEEEFIEHFIKSCYFIHEKSVKKRSKFILDEIKDNNKLPIRFTARLKGKFISVGKNLSNKNKTQIKKLVHCNNFEFIDKVNGNIKVFIDGTGNQSLVNAIEEATGHLISTNNCNFINYTISHIWERTTYNPYFFSSLWNIVIIPNYLNYIMDKPRNQDTINDKIQDIMKQICIELYDPTKLMRNKIQVQNTDYREIARKAIKEKWVNYLPERTNQEIIKIDYFDELNKLQHFKNKEFIFELLHLMKEYDLIEKVLPQLSDVDICKELFGHYYPVLLMKNGNEKKIKANTKKDKYYPNDFLNFNNIDYYVTNDWYKGEKNKRNNRNIFINWVEQLLNENI